THATVAKNTGIGLEGPGVTLLKNTIVGNNTGGDCSVAVPTALIDHSIGTDGSCGSAPFIIVADAKLGSLTTSNGGGTATHALLAGSPAIDAGTSGTATDQRGVSRDDPLAGPAHDIGAYELLDAPPVITAPDVTAEATSASGASVSLSPTASDSSPTGDSVVPFTCSPPAASTPPFTATYPLGVTTVTCTATDTFGHSSTKSFTVTVRDTTAPVIDPHADVTKGVAAGTTNTTLDYTPPTAHDAVKGDFAATCSPAPGSSQPVSG